MRRWVGRLKVWQKFAVLGVLALAMVVPAASMVVWTISGLTRSHDAQLAGMKPAADVLTLVQLTQQHRGLSAAVLGGDAGRAPARAEKQSQVDAAVMQLGKSLAAYPSKRLQERFNAMQADWRRLAARAGAADGLDGAASFKAHTAIVSEQLGLLQDVNEASTLAMSATPEVHLLNKAVLGELPALTELLAVVRGRAAADLAHGSLAPDERLRLDLLLEQGRSVAARAHLAFSKATDAQRAGPARTPLLEAITASEAAAREALALTEQSVLRPETLALSSGDYFAQMTRHIDAQFALNQVAFEHLRERIAAEGRNARMWGGLLALVLFIGSTLGVWVVVTVTRTTSKAVRSALQATEALARGDLSHDIRVETEDEIGLMLRELSRSMHQLAGVVQSIKASSDSIATGSDQIAAGNTDLSQRTEQQAANLQRTAASMHQIAETVRANADNARAAAELAGSASSVASRGGEVMARVVATMGDIASRSHRIGDIIGVIDGIAFQTNILALNAAVEAARAGEQGRGFAVVATEVRSLAQRSAQAAREIKSLIGASVEKVEEGSRLVDDAGKTMTDIVSQVRRVSDLIGEIGSSTGEQTLGIGHVSDAVAELDQVTQQNAALVEESAAAAESLKQQAGLLVEAVGSFRLA